MVLLTGYSFPRSPILEDIDISEAARALWEAPFAVLAHDKFENEDPVFTYANKARLQIWPCWCWRPYHVAELALLQLCGCWMLWRQ